MHSEATPRLPPRACSACSKVTSRRAPLAPIGWPERDGAAVDVELVVRDAEIGHRRHRDARERFVDLEQIDVRDAPSGLFQHVFDRLDRRGGEPLGRLRMRPHGRRCAPAASARDVAASSADISTVAAAPSEIFDDDAAVSTPSLPNAARRPGIFATSILPGSSSVSTTVSPLRPLTVTGTISASNAPDACAACARRTLSAGERIERGAVVVVLARRPCRRTRPSPCRRRDWSGRPTPCGRGIRRCRSGCRCASR